MRSPVQRSWSEPLRVAMDSVSRPCPRILSPTGIANEISLPPFTVGRSASSAGAAPDWKDMKRKNTIERN
jgi:hypothetical protein